MGEYRRGYPGFYNTLCMSEHSNSTSQDFKSKSWQWTVLLVKHKTEKKWFTKQKHKTQNTKLKTGSPNNFDKKKFGTKRTSLKLISEEKQFP